MKNLLMLLGLIFAYMMMAEPTTAQEASDRGIASIETKTIECDRKKSIGTHLVGYNCSVNSMTIDQVVIPTDNQNVIIKIRD